ncbi:hypothetical protein [Methylopila sp. Yamaguchi]|uniref:hypothetical protein n=1 Tax=Methylopila sp. Yamaguchi TaxID=1437817 RepID=UPI000CC7AA2C|nr:hypothetical protein [Methylopila sp. Yamaguchi]GBD50207.1 hypothetical protein METY_3420 [Methylopila sp. Yamaguchi]
MSFKRLDINRFSQAKPALDGDRAIFVHPDEVVADPKLSLGEKRALLASWASDRHALEEAPNLRQLESGAIVPLDRILAALNELDGPDAARPASPRPLRRRLDLRRLRPQTLVRARREPEDDPPPPPKPAFARLMAA